MIGDGYRCASLDSSQLIKAIDVAIHGGNVGGNDFEKNSAAQAYGTVG